ncbi:MAG: energy-coupling factor ABC transporter ATP-binding protein [Candidatus Thermoplasmatota archaeon]|nr:energy-coupling factor ABC transporter ATP-binding protein [Candidatus Thermoplasmatota archaeon]MBU1914558.1 energy-coupling factor ABC transporter ATP-binding protein [Candidatus Thermoplasmatota archaeon]
MIPRAPASADRDKIISVHGLKFVYDGGVQALAGINLDVRRGDYLAIVGGNGSGKTTLAKNLIGLLRPTSGSVTINGISTSGLTVAELAKVIGFAFQNPDHQLFCSSVVEEVRFGPLNLGFPEAEVAKKTALSIEAMGLSAVKDQPPFSLTLGERRRVSIASIMAMDPQVFILDEPTTGLDARETDDFMDCIDRLNRDGHTVVLITHDMKLVAKHAKRVVVMSEGRIVLDSDPGGVFTDLELLLRSKLVPPPVAQLAHRLSSLGVPREVLSPEELVFHLMSRRGAGK